MIRYANEMDLEILKKYDYHISEQELRNSIKQKRVLIMLNNNKFIGWLRFIYFGMKYHL